MAKVKNSIWNVLAQCFELYFKNIDKFFLYLAFPVFGQLLGMILIVLPAFCYAGYLQKTVSNGDVFTDFTSAFLILFLITLPGLFIFIKAVLDYLIAYGSLNSMTENMMRSGRVYDFKAHTELINRRSARFFSIWFILALASIVSIIPLFWIIAAILFVYFVLIFQVFTFEADKTPIGCFKKSFDLIKGNFGRTAFLMLLVGGLSCWALPKAVEFLFNFLSLTSLLALPLDLITKQLPIESINRLLIQAHAGYQLTSIDLAKIFVSSILTYVVTCMTLPLRSICWTLWYFALNKGESKIDSKILERAKSSEEYNKRKKNA